jgi:DNA-binding NtrC family response regulator
MANILVIDDENDIRKIISDMLSDKGHVVFQSGDPCNIDSILKQQNIDLVITDLVMPGKTGIDLIMELHESMPNLKIIAISGGGGITGRFDYLPIAKLIGANNIFKKPFKLSELNATIEGLLCG